MLFGICTAQILPTKGVLDHADHTDHTDGELICPERPTVDREIDIVDLFDTRLLWHGSLKLLPFFFFVFFSFFSGPVFERDAVVA